MSCIAMLRRAPTLIAAATIICGCDPHSASAPAGGATATHQETPALFANAATTATAIVRADLDFAQFALWSQQLASIDGSSTDRYAVDSAFVDRSWNALYGGPLQDLEQALRQATADNNPIQIAPVLILRAWTYSYITKMWGDVPFSSANQGDLGLRTPAYDAQSAIYDALLKDLTQSAQLLGVPAAGSPSFATNDPIYAGDAEKWRHLASALRARLGLDLVKADPTRARSEVVAAIAAGGLASNDEDATIRWPGDGTNDNPWSSRERARTAVRMSKTLVDTLRGLADPRLAIYAERSTAGGQLLGAPNGLLSGQAAPYVDAASVVGATVIRKNAPSVLMTFAEFSFIKAEAAERGWITGSAKQFYEDGIRASLQRWALAPSDISAYLAQSAVQYAGGTVGRNQIALQKWIALFTEGLDAWSEWRRTGQPDLAPVATALTSPAAIPRRLPYPLSEAQLNGANMRAAISSQSGAGLTDHTWIDK